MIKILLTCTAGEIRQIVTFISTFHFKHVCFTVEVSIDQTSRRGWVNMKYMIDIDLTKYKEMINFMYIYHNMLPRCSGQDHSDKKINTPLLSGGSGVGIWQWRSIPIETQNSRYFFFQIQKYKTDRSIYFFCLSSIHLSRDHLSICLSKNFSSLVLDISIFPIFPAAAFLPSPSPLSRGWQTTD